MHPGLLVTQQWGASIHNTAGVLNASGTKQVPFSLGDRVANLSFRYARLIPPHRALP